MTETQIPASQSGILRRREARRIAMTILYSQDCTGYNLDAVIGMVRGLRSDWSEIPAFAENLCFTVMRHENEIENEVSDILENWRLARVAPIEKALLKLGAVEVMYFPEIPPRVTINEYIELSKHYAHENAPAFINGILDKLVHRIGKPDSL